MYRILAEPEVYRILVYFPPYKDTENPLKASFLDIWLKLGNCDVIESNPQMARATVCQRE